MNSGVYQIINLINGKIYIGSAVNLKNRQRLHFHKLKHGVHENSHLQRSFNKYGKENFTFTILEIVEDESKLIEREQLWMDSLDPEYNICLFAGSRLGTKHSNEAIEKIKKNNKAGTLEVRLKMSKSHKGKILTEQHKKNISSSLEGNPNLRNNMKLNDYQVRAIRSFKNLRNPISQYEIAEFFNVCQPHISEIINYKKRNIV